MNASSDTSSPSGLSYPPGILSQPQLEDAFAKRILTSAAPLTDGQIQPASLDLRLGAKAWRVQASFLPGADHKVADKLHDLAMHEIDLTNGAVLEKGCVYIAELMESAHLPQGLTAIANPKSSTGRLDVFTRMIADYADEFEMAPSGYSGALYAEISPRTFSVLVRQGSRLSQLRLRSGRAHISDDDMMALQDKSRLTHGEGIINHKIKDGIPLSVDLSGKAHSLMPGLVGWRARKHAGLIDVDQVGVYPVSGFWEKVTFADLNAGGLVLNPDEFYILASREYVTVPAEYAAEMTAYDTRIGEFRAHYAGFFDPGFGMPELGAGETRAVLEVRSHDVPFLIEEGQTVCRLVYEPLSLVPDALYGARGSGSHYQAQGLQLAKHFQPITGGESA